MGNPFSVVRKNDSQHSPKIKLIVITTAVFIRHTLRYNPNCVAQDGTGALYNHASKSHTLEHAEDRNGPHHLETEVLENFYNSVPRL